MKTFLSDCVGRKDEDRWFPLYLDGLAVREAKRILAETEPWPGYHLWLGPYPAISRPIAQAALAEALAAFVADALLAFVERP